ncbi:MAG: cytochrome c [Acidimicrobiia bacterium]
MRLNHVAVLVLLLAAGCTGRPPADATGEEIYLQLCSNCHGEDLAGGIGPSLGSGSSSADQPDMFLEVTIMQGRGRMPSFGTTLDDEQLARLVGHIRAVQGR